MHFYYSFNSFNPMKGGMPELFGGQFKYIADKARNILAKRSIREIQFGLKTINWMYSHAELAYLEAMIIELGKEDITVYITPTVVLAHQIDKFDITEQVDLPNAQWEEYFAILALALIGNAVNYEKNDYPYLRLKKTEIEKIRQESIGDALADAMEAVCYAESIISKNEFIRENSKIIKEVVNTQIGLRNKYAAIVRYTPKNIIKRRFVDFYIKGQFEVFSFAVKEFYEELSEDQRKEICDTTKQVDEQINNLTRALKRYMKNETPQLLNPNASNHLKSA